MFEPIRGGTRGGQAEFKWSDVSADKDRENYLGHSINAPTGRWQKNKDVHWYNRDKMTSDDKAEEIRKIKETEAEALAAALGFASGSTPAMKVPSDTLSGPTQSNVSDNDGQHASEIQGKRRKQSGRKEEKKARKEKHRKSRHDEYESRHRRTRTRSRSPQPSKHEGHDRRHRSRSPIRELHAARHAKDYDEMERERERERDRRRWDSNNRERLGAPYGRD